MVTTSEHGPELAAEQLAIAAVGIPSFATEVERVSPAAAGLGLTADPNGAAWLIAQSASAEATDRFWNALLDKARDEVRDEILAELRGGT
jgi:hypothetical protein